MIVVPEDFAETTIAREGQAGREWIDALPGVVEALCEQWGLEVDGAPMHGYLGIVVPVRRGSELCALKVSWIYESYATEAAALVAWDGRGAVRLLELDLPSGAMLMERLDYSRSLDDVGIEEAMGIAGRLLRRLAIPAPAGFRSLRSWAENAAATMPQRWEAYGRPMPRRTLDRAQRVAGQLGQECKVQLIVNFDLHYTDVLAASREPWLAVDPMVVVGDPEFGVGQLLWRRQEEMLENGGLEHHFKILVEAAELDEVLTREWLLVRCVDYWLWGLGVGFTYDPARCKIIVEQLT